MPKWISVEKAVIKLFVLYLIISILVPNYSPFNELDETDVTNMLQK